MPLLCGKSVLILHYTTFPITKCAGEPDIGGHYRLLVKETVERHLLSALIPRNGTGVEDYSTEKIEDLLGNIGHYRGILLNNQTSILFSSEPDISLVGKQGITLGVIEVKGGSDPPEHSNVMEQQKNLLKKLFGIRPRRRHFLLQAV